MRHSVERARRKRGQVRDINLVRSRMDFKNESRDEFISANHSVTILFNTDAGVRCRRFWKKFTLRGKTGSPIIINKYTFRQFSSTENSLSKFSPKTIMPFLRFTRTCGKPHRNPLSCARDASQNFSSTALFFSSLFYTHPYTWFHFRHSSWILHSTSEVKLQYIFEVHRVWSGNSGL